MAGITFQKCCLVGLLIVVPLALIIFQSGLDKSELFAIVPAKRPEIAKARKSPQVEKAKKINVRQRAGMWERIAARQVEQEQAREDDNFLNPGMDKDTPHSDLEQFGGHSDGRTPSKKSAVTHIGFVKTHKASSTTMMTMLFRFGMRRNLTFVLSTGERNYFDYSQKGPLPIRPIPKGYHYDILCMHSIFNYKAFSQVLPSDTVYIGTIREPVSTFLSAVYYFKGEPVLASLMERIRKQDARFLKFNALREPNKPNMRIFSLTRNHMAKDFGFTQEHLLDADLFDKYLKFLDKKFRLVMVTERFDESLVLLKRYLNWDIKDITYVPSNVGKKPRNFQILDSDRELIRAYNYLDYKVHQFFSEKLETQIAREGSEFADEVTYFRSVLKQVSSFCGEGNQTDTRTLEISSSKWNDVPFTAVCGLLQINGPQFHKIMHIRHEKMFPADGIKETDRVINSMVH